MKWTMFGDKMPEDNGRLLICGKINERNEPLFVETVEYKNGMIIPDQNSVFSDPYEPMDDEYWVYIKNIPMPSQQNEED